MSDQAQTKPTPSQDIINAIDVLRYGTSTLYEMGSPFTAILKESDRHSHIRNLAKIGQYLADDWGGALDCKRGDLEEIAGTRGPRS